MAQTQIVQDYLKRHQIGPLFEDLMSRVIKDLPEEPAIYLIRILQRKYDRTGVVRHSDIVRGQRSRSPSPTKGTDGLQRWTVAGDSMAVAKQKTKSRKATDVTFSTTKPQVRRSTGSKPEWDKSKRADTTSFDDLFNNGRPSQSRSQQFRRSKNASPTRHVSNFDSNGEDHEDLLFRSYGYRGPKKGYSSGDPLAGEFSNAKESQTSSQTFSKGAARVKGSKAKNASSNHKKELERILMKTQQGVDSGYEESRDMDPDNAVELMEDVNILRSEGVNVKAGATGVRLARTRPRASQVEQVRVSICARCANVMNGVKSEPTRSNFGDLPSFGYETERTFPESSPDFPEVPAERPLTSQSNRSVRFSPGPSDDEDEFESVSQVTGPRRPVWQDDSDGEAVTPRKGAHMFKSSAVPSKGRPMYSSDQSKGPQMSSHVKGNIMASSMPQVQGQFKGQMGAFNQSWAPGDIQESSEEQPLETANVLSSAKTEITDVSEKDEDMPPGGQGWTAPVTDNETDASTFVYGRKDPRSY